MLESPSLPKTNNALQCSANAERDGEINLANLPNCILRLCAGDRETEREKERGRAGMVERVNRFLLFLYFLRKEGKRRRRGILRLSAPVDGRREGGRD